MNICKLRNWIFTRFTSLFQLTHKSLDKIINSQNKPITKLPNYKLIGGPVILVNAYIVHLHVLSIQVIKHTIKLLGQHLASKVIKQLNE